jgi:D-arabinose 1-dehydrogenase-like Zn-dependent alcohol dehydrogenase
MDASADTNGFTIFFPGAIMSRVRAVQVSKANGNLDVVQRDIPNPAARQVRIKAQACGICHSDSFTKMGAFPGIQFARVPGHEVVGLIDAVGADEAYERMMSGKARFRVVLKMDHSCRRMNRDARH